MPLSKAKQAEYMRDYRNRFRYNVIPNTIITVIPNTVPDTKSTVIPSTPKTTVIPNYNPYIHKPGDRVMVRGQPVTVPELDASGNAIYDV